VQPVLAVLVVPVVPVVLVALEQVAVQGTVKPQLEAAGARVVAVVPVVLVAQAPQVSVIRYIGWAQAIPMESRCPPEYLL
jgi:hypothetical protein